VGAALGVVSHGSLPAVEHDPDLALLEAWRAGDEAAGSRLLRQYFQPLRRFFANKSLADDAEDLIQATMLGCVKGSERFRGDSTFRTYLFGVARRTLAYHLRGKHNKDGRTDELDLEAVSVRELVPGPSSIVAKNRLRQLVFEALRAISIDNQIMLELYYWEPMTAAEIAQTYGMGEPAVRGRIKRAKLAFEAKLAELCGDEVEWRGSLAELEAGSWVDEIRRHLGELTPVRPRRASEGK